MIKVKEYPDWVRNEEGALVNTNTDKYRAYLAKKAKAESQQSQVDSLKSEINILNTKMDLILSLLQGNK